MSGDIEQWLEGLGLGQFAEAFAENGVDLDLLPAITNDDLKDLGVARLADRKRILSAIAQLDKDTSSVPSTIPDQSKVVSPTMTVEAERRQLTVLFCDLVGSTALSQQMDPEDLRDVMRRYQDTVGSIIERYGGFVAKFLGDGALAYFGWPQAHEDQTERAVRAGLDTIGAIQGITLEKDRTLLARGGIATGEVVIGDLIGEKAHESDAVIGDTPNLAARLQEMAEPGQLVIDATTRRLIGSKFDLHDLGIKNLKGFSEPQPVWRAEGEGAQEVRFEEDDNSSLTRFIGRQSEIGLLHETWSQAKAGEGQLILLSGEAGIGKSRLVQTFFEQISDQDYIRLRYQCSSFHTNSTLYPVVQHLRRALDIDESQNPNERLDRLEQLLHLDGARNQIETKALFASLLSLPSEDRYGSLELSPQQRKERLLRALNDQLLALSEQTPVLFLMEDAHWIDPTTQDLLEQSLPLIVSAPVFIVITHRPEWRPHWTEIYGNVTSLSLGRLPRSLVMQMVRTIFADPTDDGLVQRIASRTDGIPLYIEEITKAAMEAAYPSDREQAHVPESLQTSLLARLDRLGDAKALAQVGAVIGREFSYDLLSRILQPAPVDLEESLSRIVKSGLLFQKGAPPNSIYTFKHALVQDAAYGSLLRSTRRRLHAQIANVFETQFPDRAETEPELLAHHYTEAGLIETAIEYWHRAGEQAAERSANVEAIAHFTKGLELLTRTPGSPEKEQQELALRAGLGVPLSATKGPADLENYNNYERARALCNQFGDVPELYQILWGCWRANLVIAKLDEARDLANQLLRLAERKQDPSLILEAHHAQWTTLSRVHEPLGCWKQAEQGIAIYDADKHHRHVYSITDHDTGICCRCFGGLSLWQLGFPDRALALTDDALSLGRRLKHPTSMAHALSHSAWLHQLRRDHEIVIERSAEIDEFATERGFPQYVATGHILKGWSLTRMGHGQDGLELMKQGLDSGQAKGTGQSNAYFLHLLADAYLQTGQIQEGLDTIAEALEEISRVGTRAFEPEMHRVHAELLRLEGNTEDAEAMFTTAIASAGSQEARLLELRATTSMALLWRDQGRISEARNLLAPVYDWFTEGFDTPDLKHAKALLDELH